MTNYQVTCAHLKKACDTKNWDLLDRLLEIDNSNINDNSLYTDTWGEWWGLLLQCVYCGNIEGVRILLKHGADPNLSSWGDCIPCSPKEAAQDKPEILALIQGKKNPTYNRHTEPDLPQLTKQDQLINRQGEIRNKTGLVFQTIVLADN